VAYWSHWASGASGHLWKAGLGPFFWVVKKLKLEKKWGKSEKMSKPSFSHVDCLHWHVNGIMEALWLLIIISGSGGSSS